MNFYSLEVIDIVQETEDTVSLFFSIPNEYQEKFTFLPGQYVTVRATVGDKDIRRPYSINTIPGAKKFAISIKKVNNGLMSQYLTQIPKGTKLDIAQPDGHFTIKVSHAHARAHYFFAAGSGITPVMSMIRTILEEEPKSTCFLLYGSRNEDQIIFKNALEQLIQKYNHQLYVKYILSQPAKQKTSGLGGWLGKTQTSWKGDIGRIAEKPIKNFLFDFPSKLVEKQYYICGPGDMIESVEKVLLKSQIDSKHIHKEFFTPAKKEGISIPPVTADTGQSQIVVTLKGEIHEVSMPKNKIILDELVERKLDPPYSCTSGACSTCIAKVTSGKVSMDACYALESDEVDAGYILTCQSRPVTDEVTLTYDI